MVRRGGREDRTISHVDLRGIPTQQIPTCLGDL